LILAILNLELKQVNETLRTEIEEHRRAEEALRENTEKYKMFFSSVDEGFFIIDVIFDDNGQPIDMYYVEANKTATKMLGQDYTGKHLQEIDPNYEAYWYEVFGRVALTGENIRMEQYADPDKKWYNFYLFEIGGPESRRIGNIFENITERKRAEEALREGEEKYRLLFESMTEMFQILEPIFDDEGETVDFRYIQINKASEKLAGKKRNEIEGKTAKEIWGTVEDYWLKLLGEVLKTGNAARMENYSKEIDAYYDLYAWKADESRVAIVFSNITEHKKMEEKLAFQAGVLSSVHDAIFTSDGNYIITYWNSMAEKMFGWTEKEAIGRHSGDLLQTKVPGSSRETGVVKMLQDNYYEGEAVYNRREGSEIYTAVHAW
jgi:PAS domain S-box-containing protein